jgi:hypothetical protein
VDAPPAAEVELDVPLAEVVPAGVASEEPPPPHAGIPISTSEESAKA